MLLKNALLIGKLLAQPSELSINLEPRILSTVSANQFDFIIIISAGDASLSGKFNEEVCVSILFVIAYGMNGIRF